LPITSKYLDIISITSCDVPVCQRIESVILNCKINSSNKINTINQATYWIPTWL